MILLTPTWREAITFRFKEHRKNCRGGCAYCRGINIPARIRAIEKEIKNGNAKETETIHADKVLLDAGLL